MTRIAKIPDRRNLPSLDSIIDRELHRIAEERGLSFDFIKHGDYFEIRKAMGDNYKPIILTGMENSCLTEEEIEGTIKELNEYIDGLYKR